MHLMAQVTRVTLFDRDDTVDRGGKCDTGDIGDTADRVDMDDMKKRKIYLF